jgi:5-methyltetrahydropteroyltriglutamate--homocysteine methyltransferase
MTREHVDECRRAFGTARRPDSRARSAVIRRSRMPAFRFRAMGAAQNGALRWHATREASVRIEASFVRTARRIAMTVQQNTDHIQTTHIGSLPRPHDLLDLMKAKYAGKPYDEGRLNCVLTQAVADCVRRQVECGIEIVTDGEYSKPGFFTYIRERFEGFESRPDQKLVIFQQEVSAFPEHYAQYFKEAMMGGAILPIVPVVCTARVRYKGEAKLQIDIANVKAAAKAAGVADDHVFLPATAPSGVGVNAYYKTDEEYFYALAAELNKEYRAIVASGILLQVDDPFLPDIFVEPGLDDKQMQRRAEIYVEATNAALNGIPAERVRFHTCYGINEGPRLYESSLPQIIEYLFRVNAGSFSFEAANPRHEHEYHLFERVKVPDGKVLCPGVITHASNIVEHPEWIAERLIRYANLVGRENVMAGADCGFSSQALYRTEVHPTVVWEKFKAMRQGAELATRKMWG